MKIRTQYLILMALFGLLLAGTAGSFIVANRTVERLNAQAEIAVEIERGASDLSYMANDYLLTQRDAQRERWEATWREVEADLHRLQPEGRREERLVARLRGSHERLLTTFDEVADVIETTEPGLENSAFIRVSWSRLAVQSQGIAFDALSLSRLLQEEVEQARIVNRRLVAALLAVFTVFFVVNFLLVTRRTLGSLAELTQSTRVIGSGDLDHTINVRHDDEIGELGRAFNLMTSDLKAITASKADLEREVAERKRAEEIARQELETSEMLLEAAEAFAQWTDLPSVLGGILDSVQQMTGHTRASIALLDEAEERVQIVAARGVGAPMPGTNVALRDMSVYAQEAVKRRAPLIADYDAIEGAARGAVIEELAHLALIMPVVYQDRVVGLIRLDEPGKRLSFEERDTRVISAIASQAATAIVNARLYEEEHHVAETLQAALLAMPKEVAGLDFGCFYHSASQAARVGGDFYDIFDLEPPFLGITVGDISGKGLEAAVLTSLMKSTIRARALESGESPAAVIASANSVLFRGSPSEVFATVFYAVYDRESKLLRYCNAGHTSTILLRRTGEVLPLPSTSPLVGAFEDTSFAEDQVQFDAEDLLFLYTDGLVEARRGDEFFGEERLVEMLASLGHLTADEVIRHVSEEVVDFTGGTLGDDVAILALRPKE